MHNRSWQLKQLKLQNRLTAAVGEEIRSQIWVNICQENSRSMNQRCTNEKYQKWGTYMLATGL